LGIVLGIHNVLELNPKRINRIIELKNKEKIEQFNNNMGFAWEVGRLVGLAVNNPQKYPKRPTTYKEQVRVVQTKEDYIKEWRAFVEQNKIG